MWQNQDASLKNLEVQPGQLTNIVSCKAQRTLSCDTVKNPIEHVKAIIVGNEWQGEETALEKVDEPVLQVFDSKQNLDKVKSTPSTKSKGSCLNVLDSKLRKYFPPLPYPQKIIQNKLKMKFENFREILKNLKINIPFAYISMEIPRYAKFLKKIRNVDDSCMIQLSGSISAVLKNKLLPKLSRIRGVFMFLVQFVLIMLERLYSSFGINLMLLSIYKKLGL